MAETIGDLVAQFRSALAAAAVAGINDPKVSVILGNPGANQPDDIVSIGVPAAQLDPATITPNRTREMALTCRVVFSIFRRGGAAMETVATERAYALLSAVEEHVRVDDITLGGLVRWCLLTQWDEPSVDDVKLLKSQGRLIEFSATFAAVARLSA